jgi:ABC-2 type transport system permease protein
MNVIYILWLRELRRYVRSRAQILASLGQPTLFLVALGFGLEPLFEKSGQGSSLEFIAPGAIAMAVLSSSVFSGMAVLFDRQFGFLKETVVAPVPRLQVMAGRILGGATVAVLQGLLVVAVCLAAGFRIGNLAAFPLALLFMALIACLFAALGTAIGSVISDFKGFQLFMNLLVTPIFFLSGALYPIDHLPWAFSLVTRLNPLTYGVDALRMTLVGNSHHGLSVDALVLVLVASMFLAIGSYFFSRIHV